MEHEGKTITWEERLIYAKSFAHAEKFGILFGERIKSALTEINSMNKRGKGRAIYRTIDAAKEKVASILADKRLAEVINVEYIESIIETPKRKYGDKPARIELTTRVQVKPFINLPALKKVQDVVLTYRDQYIIEHQFHRLKGKALSIAPMFIQRDDRIDGLVKFLTIVLRPLVIIEKKNPRFVKK
jgi:transposase